MDSPSILLVLAILLGGYICRQYLGFTKGRSRLPYPPGPKPKPLLGNALDIPTKMPWLTYNKWAETYQSDILHTEALGQHIIVLNSREAAAEIMERRASIYSGRPSLPMLEMMDWVDTNVVLLPHEDKWRRHRRIFQQSFKRDAAVRYEAIEMDKIRQMLRGLLETPNDFQAHVRTFAAAIIMAIVYGHNISTIDDKHVSIIERAVEAASKVLLPGTSLVNSIPVLRHIPPWVPGVKFHRVADEIRELRHQMLNTRFDFVRKNMRDGTGEPSLLRSYLEASDADGGSAEYEDILKGVCGTAYSAGADTTASSVTTFFYAMAISPDVQQRAQSEIDAVIGHDRLPEPGDRSSLPYVEAIYREVMRWQPVIPMGIPHASTEDDVYKGFFIPKGSTIFANIWAMNHDERIYKHPEAFQPERHFDNRGNLSKDNAILSFGFGRRACVGRHLASSSVWLAIANILATLNIAKAKDEHGNEIEIDGEYTDGAIIHPRPFSCSVTPRSPKIRDLIHFEE